MTELDDRFKKRCPRQLDALPKGWCPLAVMRLKAIRSMGREPTDSEEQVLPGCPWAINNQTASYCWFVYEASCLSEGLQDAEIAVNLGISPEAVKKAATSAISKIQVSDFFEDIKKSHGDDPAIEDLDPAGFSYHD